MARKPTPPKRRRQRRHGDLPAGFVWRDGRPRWEPSPTRRAQGWRGADLKDGWGRWLAKGPAIERATAIGAAIEAWSAGGAVPDVFLPIAPRGSAPAPSGLGAASPRSIGALMDEWFESPKFAKRAAATQRDYKGKCRRFLQVLGNGEEDARIAKVRALDIDVLLPPTPGEGGEFELQRVYDRLLGDVGAPMAAGVHAVVSAWLGWIVKRKHLWAVNPAAQVEREAVGGRLVVAEWSEVVALVAAADEAGLASIGDAIALGIDLSWSQQDLLKMTWGQVQKDGTVKHTRIKTGVAGRPPLLPLGVARLEAIRRRLGAVEPLPGAPVIRCELTGGEWNPHTFRHEFAELRATVRAKLAGVARLQFRDFRDTAITYCWEAGLDIPEICSRSLHSPTRATAVIQEHYGMIRQGVADAGAKKLAAHFLAMGYNLDGRPAPAAPGAV